MSKGLRSALIIIILSFIAGVTGILLGHKYIMPNAGKTVGLHDKIHNELVLNQSQNEKLHRLEAEYESQRTEIENRMKKANAHLSAAMQSDHKMSADVIAAKEEYIGTLDEMQTLTIAHIFSMRELLTKEQAKEFDRIVQDSFRHIVK